MCRDLILASLLDGVRASGNTDAFVCCRRPDRGLRLTPYRVLLDEESESQLMRQIINPPCASSSCCEWANFYRFLAGHRRSDLMHRFNMNIPYGGLTYSLSQEVWRVEEK